MKKQNNERMINSEKSVDTTYTVNDAIRKLASTDEVSNIKKSLVELYEEWLCSESAGDCHARGTMILHFNAMMDLLTAIEITREELVY